MEGIKRRGRKPKPIEAGVGRYTIGLTINLQGELEDFKKVRELDYSNIEIWRTGVRTILEKHSGGLSNANENPQVAGQ